MKQEPLQLSEEVPVAHLVSPQIQKFFSDQGASLRWNQTATAYTYQLHIRPGLKEQKTLSSYVSTLVNIIDRYSGFLIFHGNVGTIYFYERPESAVEAAAEIYAQLSKQFNLFMASSYGGTRIRLSPDSIDYLMIHNMEENTIRQLAVFADMINIPYLVTEAFIHQLPSGDQKSFEDMGMMEIAPRMAANVYEYSKITAFQQANA